MRNGGYKIHKERYAIVSDSMVSFTTSHINSIANVKGSTSTSISNSGGLVVCQDIFRIIIDMIFEDKKSNLVHGNVGGNGFCISHGRIIMHHG